MAKLGLWLKALLPLLLLVVLVGWWLNWTLARPVGQVAIYGEVRHADLEKLQQQALPWLEVPFWKVDLAALKQALEQDPWLDSVQVSRHWPDQIRLDLQERVAWSAWNDTGLVDEKGQVFFPADISQINTGRQIFAEMDTLADALELWENLEPLLEEQQLILTELKLEARGAWQLQLNGSVRVLVGRDNIEKRINRFLWAWQTWLAAETENIAGVDLRYPNGLSVAWLQSGKK